MPPGLHAMAVHDGAALLALWEQALPLDAPARETWLARAGDTPAPAATLGAQRARLLHALGAWCGRQLPLTSRCPRCGEVLAFEVDPVAIAGAAGAQVAEDTPPPFELHAQGWQLRLRALAPADLAAALAQADADDEEAFVRALLARCLIEARHRGDAQAADALPAALLPQVAAALEAADPLASIAFDVACPACGHAWTAPFDAAQALWSCVQTAAERLLVEIDALAQRYGWSERQILALTPTRRRAYLQLAGLA